ncbi:MAG: HAMP domain-containing protein [Spirochaetaceae bacterium]|nr:HAMP domain-containing protein [Spirochaetaceae bacterium]
MRLKSRLSLSFLVVILAGSASTLLLVRPATESVYRSFVFSGDAGKARAYAAVLGGYWTEKGNWEGAQAFLHEMPERLLRSIDERIHEGGGSAPLPAEPAAAAQPVPAPAAAAPHASSAPLPSAPAAADVSPRPLETIGALLADRVALADARGIVVADTAGLLVGTAHPPGHLAHGLPVLAGGERVGTVLVGSMIDSSLSDLDARFLGRMMSAVLSATFLSAALALLLGLAFASRVTRPLALLTAAARRVEAGELDARVSVGGEDEVADLARSFNAMTSELARLEEAKRRIIADASHELRTPATLIQGALEAMIDGVYARDDATLRSVHEESVRLARLIDTLRELELVESGALRLEREPVDAREAALRAASLFQAPARAKGISLAVAAGGEGLLVSADPSRLAQVLAIFLTNALAYTPAGGRVELAARRPAAASAAAGPGPVALAVGDSGPGVPMAERGRVFERFHRVDPSRSSASGGRGLGLAIAAEIAKAHGGRIELGDSPLGGAEFVLLLPATAAPD